MKEKEAVQEAGYINVFESESPSKAENEQGSKVETITISLTEYHGLLMDEAFLNCLQACGVDNWDGYSEAVEMMNGEEE